ncbi:General stress protein 16O [Caulifigura coniformis]|uniref:General stress protein 16O n=1 Tax=Caulifigura coniformis TaxID=2527983 RepID=A0A517SAH1_9PLAN|nr:TraR/DksA family transcriptional regulator [Caulifigura coniformis]QDT53113.1 General stress protein 16O [Caulifigura coniformis]
MNHSSAEHYRKRLEVLSSRLLDDTAAMAELTHRPSGGQADGELSNAPMHLADMGTEEYLHDLNATLLENKEYLASEARAALERLDEGRFGECEDCGESIPRARLDAIPYARYCVACAATHSNGRANINIGRPNSPDKILSQRGHTVDDRSERRTTGVTEVDARRTRRMDRGDVHAVGEAGGGTASGGIAGSNFGDGEPDTAELADAMGSGRYDAEFEEDLNDLEEEDAATPASRENRHPSHQ